MYDRMMSGSKAHIAQPAAAIAGRKTSSGRLLCADRSETETGPAEHEQVATLVADCLCLRGARTRSVERPAS